MCQEKPLPTPLRDETKETPPTVARDTPGVNKSVDTTQVKNNKNDPTCNRRQFLSGTLGIVALTFLLAGTLVGCGGSTWQKSSGSSIDGEGGDGAGSETRGGIRGFVFQEGSGTVQVGTTASAPAGARATRGYVTPSAQWLVFVDLVLGAQFGQPTYLLLVDAKTGAVSAQERQFWRRTPSTRPMPVRRTLNPAYTWRRS